MSISRQPCPALRPFVKSLWVSDRQGELRPGARELQLPTGEFHIVFRLSDHPVRIFDGVADAQPRTVGLAIVGGVRATPYLRDASLPSRSVGVQLRPGVAPLLFGVAADELAHRHTHLEDIWGRSAHEIRERLHEAGSPARALDVLEQLLLARLPRIRGVHPAVTQALELFAGSTSVGEAVEQTGYSHRRFAVLFREAVGLTPKLYCRILRFQRVLDVIRSQPKLASVAVALEAGYSDQAHFTREFHELAGIPPGEYRARGPGHHVLLPRGQIRSRRDEEDA